MGEWECVLPGGFGWGGGGGLFGIESYPIVILHICSCTSPIGSHDLTNLVLCKFMKYLDI